VDKKDISTDVPLHLAARHEKTNIVKLLLPHYSDPLAFKSSNKRNALHLAVKYARLDMVELICNHIRVIEHDKNCGFKGEAVPKSGPCCSCPAIYPHLEDADRSGHTALHLGVISQKPQAVAFLLRCSKSLADTPMLNYVLTPKELFGEGRIPWTRPVHYAIFNEKRLGDMYKVLINGSADVNSVDNRGRTPLMMAKKYASSEAIDFLQSRTTVPKRQHNKR
jgi:ankyrin repeat protein